MASLLLLFIPAMTYAGVFSFVQSLFITNVEAQDVVYHNSQTIPLLAASISPDPDADKGGPEVSFDETGMFIVAETGLFSLLPGEYVSATGKEENVYIVRPGDTLSHIAELFNVKSETIRWRNDLGAKEYIRAGQDLKIPPADGVYHKIKKGDTLGGIAKAYKAETSAIKTFNGVVDASGLQVGKEIFIPGGKSSVAVKTQTSSSSQKSTYVKVLSSVPSQISSDKLGEWMWPVNGGVVTQGYGSTSFANRSGYYKGNNHGGVDIGAPRGTAIVAAKDGVVTMSQWYYGYGNLVEIKHDDGTITRYGHNTSNSVKKGQRVVQGQVIAKLGSTGRVTGPHVHFEIRDANGKQMEDNVFYQTYLNY